MTKMSTAAMTFGRELCTLAMKTVSVAIFNAPMAAEIANTKMNQNATEPISLLGAESGEIDVPDQGDDQEADDVSG